MNHNVLLMEKNLGKLVWALIPEPYVQEYSKGDKGFPRLFEMLESKDFILKGVEVTVEVKTDYFFVGFESLPKGGYEAVYNPGFIITLILDGERQSWGTIVEDQKDVIDLKIITKNDVLKKDVPDLMIMNINSISSFTGLLIDKGEIWIRRR